MVCGEGTLKDNLVNFQPAINSHANTRTLSLSHTHSQEWLSGTNPCPCIPTKVDDAVVSRSKAKIREALEENLQGPREHMESYGEGERSDYIMLPLRFCVSFHKPFDLFTCVM